MEAKGDMVGFDLDDTVYIPAARGLELFNRRALLEIDVLYADKAPIEEVVDGIKRILIARHGGEDFTVTTQQQMLDVLGSIIGVLTLGVAALGGISLLVGGVGIFTIMTIAVRERTEEVGLLRAIRARAGRRSRNSSSARRCCSPRSAGSADSRSALGRRRHALGATVDAGADRATLCRARDRDCRRDRSDRGCAARARGRAPRAARRAEGRSELNHARRCG